MEIYTSYSDEELMRLFISGSDQAFKEIYLRYDKPLYLYAYHKLGNKEEARDVVHDVFAWMLNNREIISVTNILSAYLYKSVLNKIFNLFKHQQVLKKYADAGNQYLDIESSESDFLIREKDIAATIEKEILAMPPRMREIYELKRSKFLTAKEIACQLDIAESTVSTQMKRALKLLRLKLG